MSTGVGDLRQSHFIMGQRKPNYGSEYRLEYTQKPNNQGDIKGDLNNLRSSHFEYGTYQSKNFYTSTNQRAFGGKAPEERAQLNADKLHDLRSHHFSLGNQRPGYTSTTNSQFYPKASEESARHDQVEHRNKMRRHNFDLGDSNKNYFSSVYNQQFNKTYTPDQVAQGNVKHDLKEHALNLRKTNLVLGSDPRDHFNSITRQDYGKKEGHIDGQKQSNVELRRTHYSLGVADPDFKTTNQDYFVAHPPQEVQYSKELANDLKTTHFSLGQDPSQFQSLASASYTNKANEGGLYGSVKDQNDQNRKNLVLGDRNQRTNYRTVYGSTMVPHKNTEPPQPITQDRTTSFKIGQAKSNYSSEARSHYVHYDNPEKAGLHEALMKDLQSSHFRFNEVKSNQFRTVGQTSYTNKLEESKGVNSKNHKDLQSDLTRTHFTIGNSRDAAATTVARSAYTNPHGDPAKLDDARAKDLRTHHHNFGDGKLVDKTTYNEEFFWKVNQK